MSEGGGIENPIARYHDIAHAYSGTSYAPGDAPDLHANGFLNRSHPSNAILTQGVNPSNWRELLIDNHFGNVTRFCTTGGGSWESVHGFNSNEFNASMVDALTGLEWAYPDDTGRDWVSCLVDPETFVHLGKTGWMVATVQQWFSVAVCVGNNPMLLTPARGGQDFWSSTPIPSNTARSIQVYNRSGSGLAGLSLTRVTNRRRLLCRHFEYPE